MKASQHLAVLVSIILGLGLRELLLGARNTLMTGWPKADRAAQATLGVLALFLFIVIVQFWWFLFVIVRTEVWQENFFSFLVTLARPILLFVAAASVFPPLDSGDVQEHYLRNRYMIYVPLALFDTINLAEFSVHVGLAQISPLIFHVVFIALCVLLAASRRIMVHLALLSAMLPLAVAFILLFSLTLA